MALDSHHSYPTQEHEPVLWDVDIRTRLTSYQMDFNLAIHFQSHSKRLVLMGPSGAGKTQTLMSIAGLTTPDAGEIRFKGRLFFHAQQHLNVSPQHRRVSYLFQDYALFDHLTVSQNIGFALHKGVLNPRFNDPDPRIALWLQRLDMPHAANQYPHELSGGQKQRVALARSLIHEPDALLLDEPFAALDSHTRATQRSRLLTIQQELDIPMILITHDMQDVDAFAQEIIQIESGHVVTTENRCDA